MQFCEPTVSILIEGESKIRMSSDLNILHYMYLRLILMVFY